MQPLRWGRVNLNQPPPRPSPLSPVRRPPTPNGGGTKEAADAMGGFTSNVREREPAAPPMSRTPIGATARADGQGLKTATARVRLANAPIAGTGV